MLCLLRSCPLRFQVFDLSLIIQCQINCFVRPNSFAIGMRHLPAVLNSSTYYACSIVHIYYFTSRQALLEVVVDMLLNLAGCRYLDRPKSLTKAPAGIIDSNIAF